MSSLRIPKRTVIRGLPPGVKPPRPANPIAPRPADGSSSSSAVGGAGNSEGETSGLPPGGVPPEEPAVIQTTTTQVLKVSTSGQALVTKPVYAEFKRVQDLHLQAIAEGCSFSIRNQLSKEVADRIVEEALADEEELVDKGLSEDFFAWDLDDQYNYLFRKFPEVVNKAAKPLMIECEECTLNLEPSSEAKEEVLRRLSEFSRRCEAESISAEEQAQGVRALLKKNEKSGKAPSETTRQFMIKNWPSDEVPTSFQELRVALIRKHNAFNKDREGIERTYGYTLTCNGPAVGGFRPKVPASVGEKGEKASATASSIPGKSKRISELSCNGCGNTNHSTDDCVWLFGRHPDANKAHDTTSWANSDVGKRLARLGRKSLTKDANGISKTLDGKEWSFSEAFKRYRDAKANKKRKGNFCCAMHLDGQLQGYTLQCGIQGQNIKDIIISESLIDTGALQANYIDSGLRTWFEAHGVPILTSSEGSCRVCGVAGCTNTNSYVVFNLSLLHKHSKLIFNIKIKAWLIDNLPYPIIVGRPDIVKNSLLDKVSLAGDDYSKYFYKGVKRDTIRGDTGVCQYKRVSIKRKHEDILATAMGMSDTTCAQCECRHGNSPPGCCSAKDKDILDTTLGTVPAEDYVSITDELYIIAQEIFTGSRTANLNNSHDVEYGDDFGLLDPNTAKAGRRVATQTCVIASAQGHDNTVSATQLHELYMVSLEDEVAHDIELPPVQYQYDGVTPKCKIHKDQLIDPTPDIDYIDYERQPRPWEEEGISEKMVPVVTPTHKLGEAEEIMGLAEKY